VVVVVVVRVSALVLLEGLVAVARLGRTVLLVLLEQQILAVAAAVVETAVVLVVLVVAV
jgi:hypothetical protein